MRIQSETYYRIKGSNSAYGIKKRYYSCGKNAGVRAQTLYNSVGVMFAHGSCINKFTHTTPHKNSTTDLREYSYYKRYKHMLGDRTDLIDLSSGF